MRKKICSLVFIGVFIATCCSSFQVTSVSTTSSSQTTHTDGWYYLPAYPNYSPVGIPDFDQQQDNWKGRQGIWRLIGGLWSFCGPTCLADIFWWFDSKHEDPNGYPGDGNDTYPLVKKYDVSGLPTPGPNVDDHNYNNVNNLETSWQHGKGEKEFIEMLAWYCNTNFCRYPLIRGFAGTFPKYLEAGAKQWLIDAGLQDHYTIEAVLRPEFSLLVDKVHNNSGIILNFLFYNPHAIFTYTFLGHYVAIAGINADGFIAVSDPFQNNANPTPTPAQHNDADVVSYDIYEVNLTCPIPEKGSWWIEEYFFAGPWVFAGIADYAMIITEVT